MSADFRGSDYNGAPQKDTNCDYAAFEEWAAKQPQRMDWMDKNIARPAWIAAIAYERKRQGGAE